MELSVFTLGLLVLAATHVVSFALLGVFLSLFARASNRRRMLVQSLAVTSNDDDEWLLRWRRTERRQTAMQVAYACATLAVAVGSVLLFVFQPHLV